MALFVYPEPVEGLYCKYMNDWSRTRKRIILAIVLLSVVILVGVPFFFLFYDKPTCSDAKMNGDETGVDCGGSCQRLCSAESLPLILKGDPRILVVAPGNYEVVALVQNPNANAEIYKAEYSLKVYAAESVIPVKIIDSFTFVPKGASFALFEGPFTLEAGVVPVRATLEWKANSLVWQKHDTEEPEIEIDEVVLTEASSTPRLTAKVKNLSLSPVANLDFVALISDAEGNLFAASKTYIDTLASGEDSPIVFIWSRPFDRNAAQIEVVKRVFPDRSFIR